jgi:proteasome lid subunit RPN8/RPN11
VTIFNREIEEAARAHAMAEYPRESCGLVVDGKYVPMPNMSSDPTAFEMDASAFGDDVEAVIHSHADGPPWPSAADMRGQIATRVPWGIVVSTSAGAGRILWWGDGVPRPPLIGRDFRHGPSGSDGRGDCYALIRDWYAEIRGIELPEFPRDDRWWENGDDLYRVHFPDAGFVAVPADEMRPGDVVLAAIISRVPNHGGVVLPNGLVLHHLQNRLSRTEPLGPWMRFVTHVLRYAANDPAAR